MRCAKVVFSGGRASARSSINFDQLSAGAEKKYWPKLRVHAAAQNQLVTFHSHHGLNGDAAEVLRAGFLRDRRLDLLEGIADGGFIFQIELDAADVGLVGDGFGRSLSTTGKPIASACFDGFVFAARDARLDGGNAVGCEQLLGFEFGQQRAAPLARFAE